MTKKRKGWGSLRPCTEADIKGGKKRRTEAPPLTHLVVLDFEWTADDKRRMLPIPEITQFPSVLVKLDGPNSKVVSEFNTYVRPTLNPRLTPFSTALTGITQEMVHSAPTLQEAIPMHLAWLRGHKLINDQNERVGRWYITTWSDADITQLSMEIRHKKLYPTVPACFDKWIDLKVPYARHYKKEARGLEKCVRKLGLRFEGRAHDGLVDSRNTAKLCLHMAYGGRTTYGCFVFRNATRGLDKDGFVYGRRKPSGGKADGSRQKSPAM